MAVYLSIVAKYDIIYIPAQMGGKLTYSLERGIKW
jgi:hypothetical protein